MSEAESDDEIIEVNPGDVHYHNAIEKQVGRLVVPPAINRPFDEIFLAPNGPRNESKSPSPRKSPSPHLAIISDFIDSRRQKEKAMIDKEKTPVNAADNMVKESIEKVYETAVVTTVQVEQAASLSSMIEESRSVTMDLAGQGTLPTLLSTETSADNVAAAVAFGQIKPLSNNVPTMKNHAQNYATVQEKSTTDVFEKFSRGVFQYLF